MANPSQVSFQLLHVERRHHFCWLHQLAIVVVMQANVAVYVISLNDEYFNVTGMLSNSVAFLMAVLCMHLVILKGMARVKHATCCDGQTQVIPSGSPGDLDPPTSAVVQLADPKVKCQTGLRPPTDKTTDMCTPDSAQEVIDLTTKRTGSDNVVSLKTSSTKESYVTVSVSDVSDSEVREIMTSYDENQRVTLKTVSRYSKWRTYLPGSVGRVIEELRQLCCVYVVVDLVKSLLCLDILRKLLLYLALYYWRLSTVEIISVFVTSILVIVVEVSLTVITFLL